MRAIIAFVVVTAIAAGAYFLFFAGGGGAALVAEAQERQQAACACEEFDCTTEHVAWFNRTGAMEADRIEALPEELVAQFAAVRSATAECQNALRNTGAETEVEAETEEADAESE